MNIKILIVDDEKSILTILRKWIEFSENKKHNIEVFTTVSSLEAIKIVENNKIDIVLSDIMMPEMNGVDLLKTLKKINPLIQVIIMTAYTTIERALDCYSAGANDFLLKPFNDMEDINSVINFSIDKIERWNKVVRESIKR